MKNYFVYGLIDPRNNLPFYIGKGSGNRPQSHLNETLENTINPYKFHVIQQIRDAGSEPIVQIYEYFENEQDAYAAEKEMICKFGRKRYDDHGILTNLCLDSNPPNRKGQRESEESKQKKKITNRLNRLGKKASEETKLKLSKALLGRKYANRKSPGSLSANHKQALSAANKSYYNNLSDEERITLSNNLKERWVNRRNNGNDTHSDTTKKKISESMKGKRANIPKEKVECPHCGKIGGKPSMARFHFSNCKNQQALEPQDTHNLQPSL